jgi:GNAT superfamily N-acetyltransferase
MMAHADRLRIVRDLTPMPEGAATIRAALMAFNEAHCGPADVVRLAFYLTDGSPTIRGGLIGLLAWRWLTVDLLWVDEAVRGRGYGSALLEHAERAAVEAGCLSARLDTHEYQARPFYERHGYAVFGVLEGYPHGSRTFSMRKALR